VCRNRLADKGRYVAGTLDLHDGNRIANRLDGGHQKGQHHPENQHK
jgi:hypothetical protein